jgi:hypothetical protein
MAVVNIDIYDFRETSHDAGMLTPRERRFLASTGYSGIRRREWILGRHAMHCSLEAAGVAEPVNVLSKPNGAPLIDGPSRYSVSLSHEGAYFAVGMATDVRGIGIDICARSQSQRAQRILERLSCFIADIPAALQWSAIESVLKMHESGVPSLLCSSISISTCGDDLVLSGIGHDTIVRWISKHDCYLTWCCEEEQCM